MKGTFKTVCLALLAVTLIFAFTGCPGKKADGDVIKIGV
jgi:hypothetical protein